MPPMTSVILVAYMEQGILSQSVSIDGFLSERVTRVPRYSSS